MKKFLSAVLAIVLLVTMVVLPVNAEENSSKISMGELVEKVVFSDNFDRADSAKGEIGNGWIVNGLDKYDILKISGNQMQISGSKSFSFINNVIARPANEARLNQKISTNFSGQWWKAAYFFLRMRAGETSGYAGYALELKESYIYIYRILPDGTSTTVYEGGHTKIEKGANTRIEYSAIGSNPTVLSVNIYAVADDNTETLLGSHTYEDNEAHVLQTAGTIGISGNDNNGENWNWFKLENFVYSSLEEVKKDLPDDTVFADNFDRADSAKGEIGDGWVVNGLDKYDILKISGNQMQISGSKSFSFINNVIARPANEARINQKISTNFSGQWWNTAYFFLRMRPGENSGYAGYVLALKETYIYIYRILPDGTSKAIYEGRHTKIETGKKARIEYSAIGSNPTVLSVNIYAVADNNTETLLGSHTCEDNEVHALQTAGTIGISGNDNNGENWNWFKLDDFVYSNPPDFVDAALNSKVIKDDFKRDTILENELDNGWIIENSENFSSIKISDSKLTLKGGTGSGFENSSITRPDNEGFLNQLVKVDLNSTGNTYITLRKNGIGDTFTGYTLGVEGDSLKLYSKAIGDAAVKVLKTEVFEKTLNSTDLRVEFKAVGANPTYLEGKVYSLNLSSNSTELIGSILFVDYTENSIQNIGTVSISCDEALADGYCDIYGFEYINRLTEIEAFEKYILSKDKDYEKSRILDINKDGIIDVLDLLTLRDKQNSDNAQYEENKWNMSSQIDTAANELRQEILTAKSNYKITGRTYYVSERGKDSYTGLLSSYPIKTLEKVAKLNLSKGDAVLFERGSTFRITEPLNLVNGVTYGSYGTGDKPIILGSAKNYAVDELWDENQTPFIWEIAIEEELDAGMVVFNNGTEVGIKKPEFEQLAKNGDFYHDIPNNKLYLYLDKGSPADVYDSIEIGLNKYILRGADNRQDITIDNIALKYTGGFGIRFGNNSKNIKITNCEIGWIGGSYSNNAPYNGNEISSRWGNGIEFWVGTENALIENCYVYQCFDAGITYQVSSDYVQYGGVFKDVTFRNNLLEYNTYNIEYFIGKSDIEGKQENILIEDNIMRFAGYGWGYQRPDKYAIAHICAWKSNPKDTTNFVIKDNIFDSARYYIFSWYADGNELSGVNIENNTYYQTERKENHAVWSLGDIRVAANNQAQLEEAISLFDKTPKLVKWLDK